MTYSVSNNCTKNYYNRTLTVQVIVEDVVTWIFFETQCRKLTYSDITSSIIMCTQIYIHFPTVIFYFWKIHYFIYYSVMTQ